MKKISLLFFSFLFVLSGCGQQAEKKDVFKSDLTEHDKEVLQKLEDTEYKSMTPEEEAILEKSIKDIDRENKFNANEEENDLKKQYDLAVELDNTVDAIKSGDAVRGSCNAIPNGSTCIEYVGSFWTDQQMESQCNDSGTFSKNPCPQDTIGGCNIGKGLPSDMVTWFYLRGGGELDEESVKFTKGACDATMASEWITK